MASTSRFAIAASRAALLALALAGLAAAVSAQPSPAAACASPLRLAVQALQATHDSAAPGEARARAAAALGAAYLRLNRFDDAERLLRQALEGLGRPREKAAAALDLGNLHLARRQYGDAGDAWGQAAALAAGDGDVALAVELNRLRLPEAVQRLQRLQAASGRIEALPDAAQRARHALNIAAQAKAERDGTALAYRMYEAGRTLALQARHERLAAEAYDGLADLYEAQQRPAEALRLAEQGVEHAQRVDARELLITLEWRVGRLTQQLGRPDFALAAYRRAVQHIEAVRSDIPVQYQDGRSSFRETLEPIYLGLTDLLLRQSAAAEGAPRSALLRQARDTVELIKQTELEDFLRDRCTIDSARNDAAAALPAATAIYYPVILPDRLELLLETAQGIERRSVDVGGDALRKQVLELVSAMRAGTPFQARAEAMYRWLIAPIDELLVRQGIQTLVSVPDGVLRLLPLAALHDGHGFLIERLAVATVPGLTMTASAQPHGRELQTLLAGMSEPGPVVNKLSPDLVTSLLDPPRESRQARGGTRAMRGAAPRAPELAGRTDTDRSALRANALREALALPGVKQEIENIARVVPQRTALLDSSFTLAALKQQLLSRPWQVVHIASHGVFGDSADDTFIMTYDELLTLDGLQALLRDERFRKSPIELITLSACQTAEGDDRAPLGMSGTALKARARSALGTLWPVSDDAANQLMSHFYRLLAEGRHSKIGALREAQLQLIGKPQSRHPFFWAPFILIGEWQ